MVEVVMALLFGFIGAFAGAFCATFLLLRYLTLQRGEYQHEVVQEVQQCPLHQDDAGWEQSADAHYFLNSTVLRHWWLGSSPPQEKRGGEG